jgi:hypothetical protein
MLHYTTQQFLILINFKDMHHLFISAQKQLRTSPLAAPMREWICISFDNGYKTVDF